MAKRSIRTYQVGKIVVNIDRSRCTSCGICTAIAPEIFELDDELISQIKKNPNKKATRLVKEAANNCSSEAIKIIKEAE